MAGIQTRITELFKIRYPIIQGGMVWVAGYKLAAAVSNCGGLGLIGGGSMEAELFRHHIQRCRKNTRYPFGVNIPLIYDHAESLVRVALEEQVGVIFTSAGDPGKYTEAFHKAGALVAHVVPSVALACKAAQRGVDVIVAEGTEAGGHNAVQAISTMVLTPQVVDAVERPVISAGGIADGRGLAAALALGADGVQIGTRFACTVESSAHDNYKKAVVAAEDDSTVLTCWKTGPTRMIHNAFAKRILEAEAQGAAPEEIRALAGRNRAKTGIFEGDLDEGKLESGQVAGMIQSVLTVRQVFDAIIAEYAQIRGRLPSLQ